MPRKPKTIRRIRFTVSGLVKFPDDMLRYDSCEPAEPEDEQWLEMARKHRKYRVEMMLQRWLYPHQSDHGAVTTGRWESFLWTVTEIYPVEKIPFEFVPDHVKERMGY